MRSNIVTLAILFAILAVPLRGEVVESAPAGFLVRNTAAINAPPATVYAALTDGVGGWWDPAHTLSMTRATSRSTRNRVAASASGCRTEAAFST
jgi:hypothetical protein